MVLTQQKTTASSRDFNKFPAAQLFLLALVRLAEPIALFSIFPYAWKLVLDFHVGDRANASFYSGLLIASFALAESLSGVFWGGLSDRIGRKPVLIMGSVGTIISLLILGFSFNFWMALFGRFLGGALNGNVGVVQTMVGELVVNPKHEPTAYAVMPFAWAVGTIIGPAVGGYFAMPGKNFPGTALDNKLFRDFPYLLPNLICAALMLASIVAAYFCLQETHPDMQPHSELQDDMDAAAPLMASQPSSTIPAPHLSHEASYGTFNDISEEATEEHWNLNPDGTSRPASLSSGTAQKVYTRRVVMLMVALGLLCYHSMTYDHLFPVFLQDDRIPAAREMLVVSSTVGNEYGSFAGGLGLSVQQTGVILAFNGLIALFVQACIFPMFATWVGIWRTFIIVAVLHPVAYFIVPWLALLPDNLMYPGIYACLAVRNFLSIVLYPVLLILIKEASPSPKTFGKINGLAASTGAACRTMASPVAGLLYGIGDKIEFTALAWWASALVALIGAFQAFTIKQEQGAPRHNVRPIFMPEDAEQARRRQSSVIHIRVEGDDSGYGTDDEGAKALFASRVPRRSEEQRY